LFPTCSQPCSLKVFDRRISRIIPRCGLGDFQVFLENRKLHYFLLPTQFKNFIYLVPYLLSPRSPGCWGTGEKAAALAHTPEPSAIELVEFDPSCTPPDTPVRGPSQKRKREWEGKGSKGRYQQAAPRSQGTRGQSELSGWTAGSYRVVEVEEKQGGDQGDENDSDNDKKRETVKERGTLDASERFNRKDFRPRRQRPWSARHGRITRNEAMKFSHSIQFNAVPDWSGSYLFYSNLKKL